MAHIATVLVDRANYGRLKPVMQAIEHRNDLRQSVICAGSMVLDRFKRTADLVRDDGFHVVDQLYCSVEGNTPETMARGVGMAVEAFTHALERLSPDFVLIIGDRSEALGAAIAAAYSNRCIVHLQGGEVSGSIDESARHAITQLAHYHVPATATAKETLLQLGQHPATILATGCPSADLAAGIQRRESSEALVIYHPTTTSCEAAAEEVKAVLAGLWSTEDVTLLWPNIDAGSDAISKAIRQYRDHARPSLRIVTHIPADEYLQRLANARVAVGNSSSFVRDSSYFGTPVVLVGDRQAGREAAHNVMRVKPLRSAIEVAVDRQIKHGAYEPSDLYGRPGISQEIASQLAQIVPYAQKSLYARVSRDSRPCRKQGNPREEHCGSCG